MAEVNEMSNQLTVLIKKYFVGRAILQRKEFKWLVHTPFGVKFNAINFFNSFGDYSNFYIFSFLTVTIKALWRSEQDC